MVGIRRLSPAELVADWPHFPSEDVGVEVARRISLELRQAVDEHGVRGFARLLDLNHATLLNVIDGRTYPTVQLVARMEAVLRRSIWPGVLPQA